MTGYSHGNKWTEDISIHALLTEGDWDQPGVRVWGRISIHALLTEGDSAI